MTEEKRERKPKNNFRIHLTGNKYIIGDSMCFWIVSETHRKGEDGEQKTVQKRLSGYHTEFVPLIESYFRETIKNAEIDGELSDLMHLVVKTRAEIRRWFKILDDAKGDSE